MDERTIKRLLIIVVASIIAIMLLKIGLTKTFTTLNQVAVEKKRATSAKPAETQQPPTVPAASEVIEAPAASAAVESSALETPASSGVSETPGT